MQVTSVAIHEAIKTLDTPTTTSILTSLGLEDYLHDIMTSKTGSLNDVCVLLPAAFGAIASMLTGLLAVECMDSVNAGVAAAAVMSVLPAHLMRSVAGGYDNESIAVSAIACTFFLWCRSLRTPDSWRRYAVLCGLSYFYMVSGDS
jgi:dolichyl-diphosphooligosaccharide--protein glycosyltransferase|eukprot:COSAG01_NODE_5502_length_4220_cov_2.482893_2_plen_146_part_00